MKYKTKIFYLMGECECDYKTAVDALQKREENLEWAEEYIFRRHLEGDCPEWIAFPKWFNKEMTWSNHGGNNHETLQNNVLSGSDDGE